MPDLSFNWGDFWSGLFGGWGGINDEEARGNYTTAQAYAQQMSNTLNNLSGDPTGELTYFPMKDTTYEYDGGTVNQGDRSTWRNTLYKDVRNDRPTMYNFNTDQGPAIFSNEAFDEVFGGVYDAGGTYEGAKAGYSTYELLKINKMEQDAAKKELMNKTSKKNLDPYVVSSDSGFFYKEGGFIDEELDLAAVQTDKDEVVLLPDMTIVRTSSTKDHKDMEGNKVTDILPKGSYIASDEKKYKLKKKDYEKELMYSTTPERREGEKQELPKEVYFSELFTKNEMTPAELMWNLSQKMAPINLEKAENDPLTNSTIPDVLKYREMWASKIIDIAEGMKKGEKKKQPKRGDVPKFEGGGWLEDIFGLYGAINPVAGYFLETGKARKTAKENQKLIDTSNKEQQNLLGLGTAVNVLAAQMQDPTVETSDVSLQREEVERMDSQYPEHIIQQSVKDIYGGLNASTGDIFKNTTNFYTGMAGVEKLQRGAQSEVSKMRLAAADKSVQMRKEKTLQKLSLEQRAEAERVAAINQMTANINAKLANTAAPIANYTTETGKLVADKAEKTMANNTALQNALTSVRQSTTQNLFNMASMAMTFATGMPLGGSTGNQTMDALKQSPYLTNDFNLETPAFPKFELSTRANTGVKNTLTLDDLDLIGQERMFTPEEALLYMMLKK